MQLHIDVVGVCNLSCPSCPQGNSSLGGNVKNTMDLKMFESIVLKAVREMELDYIALYNWTEPLIHPQLPEMIKFVKKQNIPVYISSNLNITKRLDAVLEAAPDKLIVSTSGWAQDKYEITHRGGDVNTVISNMKKAGKVAKYNRGIQVEINYHRYNNNTHDEIKLRKFAKENDIGFISSWAYLMPLERVLEYVKYKSTRFANDVQEVISKFVIPLDVAISLCKKSKIRNCKLRDEQIIIDAGGNVVLCCTVFNQQKYRVSGYLNTKLNDIQIRKNEIPVCRELCNECMNNGLHVLALYNEPRLHIIGCRQLIINAIKSKSIRDLAAAFCVLVWTLRPMFGAIIRRIKSYFSIR